MAINFPSSPTNNQVFTNGNVQYTYNTASGVWLSTTSSPSTEIIPGMQLFRLNSDVLGSNSTGAQNVFGVGVTLTSSTVYQFEFYWTLSKTSGTVLHFTNAGFGGTVSFNNFLVHYLANGGDAATAGLSTGFYTNSFTLASISTTGTNTAVSSKTVSGKGTISVASGGTFIPQYSLSAAPGGAYSTLAGSYFAIWPIGAAGSNISIGSWA